MVSHGLPRADGARNRAAGLALFIAAVAMLGVGCLSATPRTSGPIGGSATRASSAESLSASAAGSSTPAVIPGTDPPSSDLAVAIATAERFERSRAAGDDAIAWNLLAPRAQDTIGTLDRFHRLALDEMRAGGAEFRIGRASQDRQQLSRAYLGDAWTDVARADTAGRAWIIEVVHPGIRAASAGSEVLLAAPDDAGTWRIWIVH